MPKERRKGTINRYVTRVERVGSRLRKRYVGRANHPCIDLLERQRELVKADDAAAKSLITDEIATSKHAEDKLDKLLRIAVNLKVLHRLRKITSEEKSMAQADNHSNDRASHFPGLHLLNKTCREADSGNVEDQARLGGWLGSAPEMVSEATDLVALVEGEVIELTAGDSPETLVLLQCRVESESERLTRNIPDDPLTRLGADVDLGLSQPRRLLRASGQHDCNHASG